MKILIVCAVLLNLLVLANGKHIRRKRQALTGDCQALMNRQGILQDGLNALKASTTILENELAKYKSNLIYWQQVADAEKTSQKAIPLKQIKFINIKINETTTLINGLKDKVKVAEIDLARVQQEYIAKCITTTTTSTTTTTLAPTTTTLPPCGETYDLATNNPDHPLTLGFFSGVYKDFANVYPGYGNYATCDGYRPGRVTTKSPAGVYNLCRTSEIFDGTGGKYFASHPNLRWVTTSVSEILSVVGIIKVKNSIGDIHCVTRHNLTGYQQIGAYWIGGTTAFYWGDSGAVHTTGTVEVLACQDSTATMSTTTMTVTSTVAPNCFNNNDRILSGTCMNLTEERISKRGCFRLKFQNDGNLVVSRTYDDSVIWSSLSFGKGGNRACMQTDGNFVIYSASAVIWTPSTGTPGSYAVIQDDANFIIYKPLGGFSWASNKFGGCL